MRAGLLSRWPVAIIGLAIAVTGCSSASTGPPAATKIVADMKAALARATSARVAGDLGQPGQPEPIDLAMTRSGDISGLYSYDGVSTTVIITPARAYVLLSPAYYRYLVRHGKVLSAPCATICGRYVLRSPLAAAAFKGFFSGYLRMFPLSVDVTATTRVTAVTYQGQAAYEFSDTNGDRIYISRSDYPYPIAVVSRGGSPAVLALEGTTRFSQWNAVPPITAPPASHVITERSLFANG